MFIHSEAVRDFRIASRALTRTPAFTVPAIGALAIGLALLATTLVVVNAYLIRSLPYPAADRLYHVVYAPVGTPEPRAIEVIDWQALADIVEFADSSAGTRFTVTTGATTDQVLGVLAAPGTSDAFAIRVALGHGFAPGDFDRGAERVALISQSLWRNRFGGDSMVVGRTFLAGIDADTAPPTVFRIVGVLADEYRDARSYARRAVDIVAPLRESYPTYIVRLRAGVPPSTAANRLTSAIRTAGTGAPSGWRGVELESLNERYARPVRPVLTAFTVAAVLVLLIVCANVAVLILLRNAGRQTEVAVRVALGAGTLQIVRFVAVESVLICGAGLGIGIAISVAVLRLLSARIPVVLGQPVPGEPGLHVDPSVSAMMLACGIAVAAALSVVPFVAGWRQSLVNLLHRRGRGATDSRRAHHVRNGLVALQLAVSVTLGVGCGLTVRSAVNMIDTNLGIRTDHLWRVRVVPPRRIYPDNEALNRLNARLVTSLQTRFGAGVAFSSFPVLIEPSPIAIEANDTRGTELAGVMAVSADFFHVMSTPVLRGRDFTDADHPTAEPVAIVSETLARRLFPSASTLGGRVRIREAEQWRTVVGVVSDVRQSYVDDDLSDAYVPFLQAAGRFTSVYGRTDMLGWVDSVRAAVGQIDPAILVSTSISVDGEAQRPLAAPKFLATVLATFAVVAMVLAVLGSHAVVAYAVQQRAPETAIRVALGAAPSAVRGLFFRQAAVVVGVGITCGAIGALALGRVLRTQLHGVSAFDLATIIICSAAVGIAALAFVWWPARRAGAMSPAPWLNET